MSLALGSNWSFSFTRCSDFIISKMTLQAGFGPGRREWVAAESWAWTSSFMCLQKDGRPSEISRAEWSLTFTHWWKGHSIFQKLAQWQPGCLNPSWTACGHNKTYFWLTFACAVWKLCWGRIKCWDFCSLQEIWTFDSIYRFVWHYLLFEVLSWEMSAFFTGACRDGIEYIE